MRMRRHANRRGRLAAVVAAVIATTSVLTACGPSQPPNTINLYISPEENLQQIVDRCNRKADGRYHIVYHKLPRGADNQRAQMVRRLAAHDSGMDILGLDTTWTAEFANAGWIRPWTGANKREAMRGTLPGPLESATYEGELYAAPKNTNVQLLWYRADLVDHAPKTWAEMIEMSQRLKAQGKPYRILLPGAEYEGFVVEFNTLVASAGGTIVSDDGERAVVDEGVVKALEILKKLATSGVTSPSFSNAKEDDVRRAFQNGKGAFQLNWPYVYASMKEEAPELAKKVEWARYPAVYPGKPSRVTIGGFNLAVSSYSDQPRKAFDAALCLRNPRHQKIQAIKAGVPPTIGSVYKGPKMAEKYPMRETIKAELKNAAVRPVTPAYQSVSTVLSNLLSPPSSIQPEKTAKRMREEVQKALDSRGVLP